MTGQDIPTRINSNKQTKYLSTYQEFEPPTKIIVLMAVNLCTAEPKPAETKAFKVASIFASGMTTA